MRLRFRAAAFFALTFAAITCTEAPTGPKWSAQSAARVAMRPSFTPEAARIYSGLAAFGIEVTEVHVRLTGPDGIARDTVIAFPPGRDTLVVEIELPGAAADQTFSALLELRNAEHVVLFSGTQSVVARSGAAGGTNAPVVTVSYTGPGRGTRTVSITPGDTTVSSAAGIPFSATAIDSSGRPVTDLLVVYKTSDATLATVTATGNSTATITPQGRRGVATITAMTASGVTGSARLTMTLPAARVVAISGGGQTGFAGTTLSQPLVAEVQASDNLPVPFAPVTFRSVTAGGSVQRATAIADANGRATSTLTLGPTAGTYVYEAGSGALTPASVSAIATVAPAAAIAIVSGDAQVDSVGRTLPLPLVVRVTNQLGAGVAGATVNWTRVAGNGVLGAATSTTASDGSASIAYTLGNSPSSDTVRATVAGLSGAAGTVQFSMRGINRGAASIAIIAGGNQSGAPNALLPTPLVAQLLDVNGSPVQGAPVIFGSSTGNVAFTTPSSNTDAVGQASTTVRLGPTPGTVAVTARSGTLSAATSLTITGSSPSAVSMKLLQAVPASITVGVPFPAPIQVQLIDANGNNIAQNGVTITAVGSVTPANTSFTLQATTNASGLATFTLLPYVGTSGSLVFTLTAPNVATLTTSSITINPGAPAAMVLAQQPGGGPLGTVLAPNPAVQLVDAGNNPSPTAGVNITAAIATGGGTVNGTTTVATNSTGRANFTNVTIGGQPGPRSLSFTSGNLPSITTGTFPVTVGVVTTLAVNAGDNQTATVNSTVAIPPSVKITDSFGNPVPGQGVSFQAVGGNSLVSTGGTPSIAVNTTTNAAGIASLTSWTLGATTGTYQLQVSAIVTTGSPLTMTATAVSGTGAKFTLVSAPTTITVGAAVPTFSVQIADASNNPVTQAGVPVTLTLGTATPITATTNASGIATFNPPPYAGASGVITATFASPGYTSLVNPITVAVGPAAALQITTQPSSTASSGATFATQPVVQLVDAGGNLVSQAGQTISATLASGSGTLSGATAVTNSAGTASFTNLAITGTPGAFTLQFTLGSIVSIPSGTITLTAGSPATMVKSSGDGQTAPAGTAVLTQPQVLITDATGNPVPNIQVTFAVASGGGSVTGAVVTTTVNGVASVGSWTLGNTAGPNSLTAAAGNLSVTFTATGTAGSPSTFAPVGSLPASLAVGASIPTLQFRLVDAAGNPVTQVVNNVAFTANVLPQNQPFTTTVNSDAAGVITINIPPYLGTIGTANFVITAPGVPNTYTSPGIPMVAGAAKALVFTTQPASTVAAGVALSPQPALQIVDAGGNAVSQSGLVVNAIINNGPGGSLGGTTSVTSNSSGQILFTNLSINGPGGVYSLVFVDASDAIFSPGSNNINVISVGPSKMLLVAQSLTTQRIGSSGDFLSFTIQMADASNNPVAVSGVQVVPSSGPEQYQLDFVNGPYFTNAQGQVVISGLQINDVASTSHRVYFDATVNQTALPQLASNSIALIPGPATTVVPVNGRFGFDQVGTITPHIAPVFAVTDGHGTPSNASGQTISVAVFGRCRLNFGQSIVTSAAYTTNASGQVTPNVLLPTGADGAGCVVRANFLSAAVDSMMLAVYPATTTHIFNPNPQDLNWQTATNWFMPATQTNGVPNSPSDRPFVPNYTTTNFPPVLHANTTVGKLMLDTATAVSQNGFTLDVGSGGVSGFGFLFNGLTRASATSTLNGVFDKLDIGSTGNCGVSAPVVVTLGFASAADMNVYCRMFVDTTAVSVSGTFTAHPASRVMLQSRGVLTVGGLATFNGDSLGSAGAILLNNLATIGGNKVFMSGTMSIAGTSTFNALSATYQNANIVLQDDVVFGGGSTGTQSFQGGTLQLNGDLTQLQGAVGSTFTTSSDHLTSFFSSTRTQTISMANPTQSLFSQLQIINTGPVGVILATNAALINGTSQPRFDFATGKLTINAGAVLNIANGSMRIAPAASFTINGSVIGGGSCTGRSASPSGTISGSGTYAGVGYTGSVAQMPPTFCTP